MAELLGSRPQISQPVIVEHPTTRPADPVVVTVANHEDPMQTRKHVVEFIRGTKVTRGEFQVSVDANGNEVIGKNEDN